MAHLKPALRGWAPLVAALLAVLPAWGGEVIRLERREPDYRFRFHAEYRLPGQRPFALALRGGSAKGLAHLGVLQGLDRENLPVDAIVGTSAGSLMGSLYASGFSGNGIARIFKSRDFGTALDDRRREAGWSLSEDVVRHSSPLAMSFRDGRLDLMPGGSRSKRYRAALMPMLGRASWLAGGDFDRLRMPLRVVTSDLTVGRGRVFAGGSLVDVVAASTCLPGIFEPVVIDGHQYVDGGPFENLPVQVAREAFPGMLEVAVAIGRPWDPLPKTNIATLLDASLEMSMAQTEARSMAQADLVIRPDLAGAAEFDFFNQVDDLVKTGRKAFDLQRPALDVLVYGPASTAPVASGVDLADGGVPGAGAWLAARALPERPGRAELCRLLRLAHRDLAIAGAVLRLPEDPGGRAVLELVPAPPVKRLELDLPPDWPETVHQRIFDDLKGRFGLEPGRPFHEGAWSLALESLLVEAIISEAPILDLQGSGFMADGTLKLRVREPRVAGIRSRDAAYQVPLDRYLAPVLLGPVRTSELEENLARAANRFGVARLKPDFGQEAGALVLVLDPARSAGIELSPHLAYETRWGGFIGLDVSAPNVLGSGSPFQFHVAVDELQTLLQGSMLWVPGNLPSMGVGLFASRHKQWFRGAELASVDELARGNYGLRTEVRFGREHRGLLFADLGRTDDRTRTGGVDSPSSRGDFARLAAEWDSFDSHTLASRGFLVRTTLLRQFHSEYGSDFTSAYLRIRRLWAPGEVAGIPMGIDLDTEVGAQDKAPASRGFILGGPEFVIGTERVGFLSPNFTSMRLGFPLTATTLFGIAVQAVPRLDLGRLAPDVHDLKRGHRLVGCGISLRGALKSLFVELAGGTVQTRDLVRETTRRDTHVSLLIGTRPYDIWMGR